MKIRTAKPEDLPYIKAMCDRYISIDYYSTGYMEKAFRDPDHYFTVYANDADIPVAFIYMFVTTFAGAVRELKIPAGIPALSRFSAADRVGIFKTTCTQEEYRRHGILLELIHHCENIFRDIGIETILLNALRLPSGKIPAGSGIEKTHFTRLAEISHPWSDLESYCPYCKQQRCICDAVLCYKEVSKGGEGKAEKVEQADQ